MAVERFVLVDGGIFVAVTPDIVYLKDTTTNRGRGGCSTIKSAPGFGGSNAPAADRLITSLTWGPDYRIHGLSGGLGGLVSALGSSPRQAIDLTESNFSFDPFDRSIRPETRSGSSGIAFDHAGRKFVSDAAHPLGVVGMDAATPGGTLSWGTWTPSGTRPARRRRCSLPRRLGGDTRARIARHRPEARACLVIEDPWHVYLPGRAFPHEFPGQRFCSRSREPPGSSFCGS